MPSRALLLACIAIPLAATGCVDRALVIRSDPPGATVFVDGKEIGTTPARLPFQHYGTREVMVRMERRDRTGEEIPLAPVTRMVEVDAPWYQYFPIDLFTEFLWPGIIHDEHVVEVALVPHELDELQERFETRARAQGVRLPFDPPPAPEGAGDGAPAPPAGGVGEAPPGRP